MCKAPNNTPYGYRLVVTRELIPDTTEQETVRLIVTMRQHGKSLDAIAQYLNTHQAHRPRGTRWYSTTVNRILRREAALRDGASLRDHLGCCYGDVQTPEEVRHA